MSRGKIYETTFGEIEHILPDILVVRYHKVSRILVDHIKLITEHRQSILGEKKYYAISDFSKGIITMDNEAKRYLAKEKSIINKRFMDLVIVSNWATQMEAKMYMKFFKPDVDTKVVRSLDEAVEVINDHRNEKV